jgi:predicted DNA-binding transcriptional regulator AlpA
MNESTKAFDELPDAALVPVKTVAIVLGVSVATVWRLSKAGRLTPRKIGLRSTRFKASQIRDMIQDAARG